MRIAPIVSTAALALVLQGCAVRQAGREEIVVTAAKAGGDKENAADAIDEGANIVVAGNNLPAPSPAPPPPPGLMTAPVSPAMVGQASPAYRMAQQTGATSYIPSVVVPADPGAERYGGKTVSPVHLTASEPVSTFSVDVDTGAYANSRRFL